MPQRRAWLMQSLWAGLWGSAGASAWSQAATPRARPEVRPGQPLQFPRDHGAHPDHRTEWWYLTGHLQAAEDTQADPHPGWGFQVTIFRTRVDEAEGNPSALAAHQLLMAHVALTDLQGRQLLHDQRLLRAGLGLAGAQEGDTAVHLRDWRLQRQPQPAGPHATAAPGGSRYQARLAARQFALDLTLDSTQPLLLQGPDGYSRKGPDPLEASHYYSQPQLAVRGTLRQGDRAHAVRGLAWMDHEWSEGYLPARAVGWDWLGMNLRDGGALMLFRMRDAQGRTVWAGGTHRPAGGPPRHFKPDELRFEPLQHWRSPATGARYPIQWRLHTPLGALTLKARLPAQELDGQASTGAVYWEGLSDLLDARGQAMGQGYLEMTGYVSPLRMR